MSIYPEYFLPISTYTPSHCRQRMCAASVHVALDKWMFTLNPSMKYHCWKTAMCRFYTEIVLQLITSGTEETNKAVKIKKATIWLWIQTQANKVRDYILVT